MKDIILSVLDEMGYFVFDCDNSDIDIRDFIADSLQFIEFIVCIERKLNIDLSDDFLEYELLFSLEGFSNKLAEFCIDAPVMVI